MPASAKYVKARQQWGVAYYQHGTRWLVTKGIRNKQDAEADAKRANERMEKGEDLRPGHKQQRLVVSEANGPTALTAKSPLLTFANRWLVDVAPTLKGNTTLGYEKDLRLHIGPAIGHVALAAIDRPLVKQLLHRLIGKPSIRTKRPLGNKTRESVQATLCVILESALERNLITVNPARHIKNKDMHDPNEIEREIHVWTPDEAERALAICKERYAHWYPFFFVALRTGPRFGELAELRWELDFRRPSVMRVQRSWASKKRVQIVLAADGTIERRRTNADRVTPTKGKRLRYVDLFPEVEQVLKAHRATQRAWAFERGLTPSLVFTGPNGARLDGTAINRVLRHLERLAHVPRLTIHGLRHTYATVNLSRGQDLKYVSEQLGHANVQTTEQHYSHWIPDSAEQVARRREQQVSIWKAGGESGTR